MLRLLATSLRTVPCFATTPILSLSKLIELRQSRSQSLRDAFENTPEQLFQYGCDPLRLRLELQIFYKFSYWQTSSPACSQLQLFYASLQSFTQQYLKASTEERLPMETDWQLACGYMKEISMEILPSLVADSWIAGNYLKQLRGLLCNTKGVGKDAMYFILGNLERLALHKDEQLFIADQNDAWALAKVTELFLQHLVRQIEHLPLVCKSTAIMLAKTLKVTSLPFLEFLKRDIQKASRDLTLQYFLAAMIYLGMNRSFPFEYFYRQKGALMGLLEAADDLSEKKVFNCIAMLEIFSRQRLPHCERIIARLQRCIELNLPATDVTQLTRIFHYYSRLRSSPSHAFLSLVVQRLYLFLDQLDEKHYALIVRAVATLNYCDPRLVSELKNYDYHLFLANLKFGCAQLGPYYAEILRQVEREFLQQSDTEREVSYEGQPFVPV